MEIGEWSRSRDEVSEATWEFLSLLESFRELCIELEEGESRIAVFGFVEEFRVNAGDVAACDGWLRSSWRSQWTIGKFLEREKAWWSIGKFLEKAERLMDYWEVPEEDKAKKQSPIEGGAASNQNILQSPSQFPSTSTSLSHKLPNNFPFQNKPPLDPCLFLWLRPSENRFFFSIFSSLGWRRSLQPEPVIDTHVNRFQMSIHSG
jgi:hypothetical protein